MGLDMYLTRHVYVKNWGFMSAEQLHTVTVTGPRAASINTDRISSIVEDVGYWRKANAIHRWFVENVQGGEDECRLFSVTREQLGELLALVRRVLIDPKLAPDVLPVQSGFFFGNTEYGPDYIADLNDTVLILAPIVEAEAEAEPDCGDYYYRSSW